MSRGAPRAVDGKTTARMLGTAARAQEGKKKPGPKPGTKLGVRRKTGGRQTGGKNKSTVRREETFDAAISTVFDRLTEKQIDDITPLEVMTMILQAAVRSKNVGMMMMTAKEIAPYCHAKLFPREVDHGDGKTVVIKGGLPDDD